MSLEKREAEACSPNTPVITTADLKYGVWSRHFCLLLSLDRMKLGEERQQVGEHSPF